MCFCFACVLHVLRSLKVKVNDARANSVYDFRLIEHVHVALIESTCNRELQSQLQFGLLMMMIVMLSSAR